MTTQTGQIQAKSFDVPDQTRDMAGWGRLEIVDMGRWTAVRGTMKPGFHWTEHARPVVGTDLCQAHHMGYVLSGGFRARLADGTERDYSAGDVFDVPPGHDMWVLGDEPYTCIEFAPAPNH